MFYHTDNCDIASYAETTHNAPVTFNLEELIQKLELNTSNLLEGFKNSYMKANADKCH